MDERTKDAIWLLSTLVCTVSAFWMAFNLLFPVGWDASTEYLQYRFQFQEVHRALVNCSQQGGVLLAQVAGSTTSFKCDLNHGPNLTGAFEGVKVIG